MALEEHLFNSSATYACLACKYSSVFSLHEWHDQSGTKSTKGGTKQVGCTSWLQQEQRSNFLLSCIRDQCLNIAIHMNPIHSLMAITSSALQISHIWNSSSDSVDSWSDSAVILPNSNRIRKHVKHRMPTFVKEFGKASASKY